MPIRWREKPKTDRKGSNINGAENPAMIEPAERHFLFCVSINFDFF